MQSALLRCHEGQLNLDVTLTCGQSFRWTKNSKGEWTGVLANKVWFLKQDDTGNIHYKVVKPENEELNLAQTLLNKKARKRKLNDSVCVGQDDNAEESVLRDYFQLNVDVEQLYQQWASIDPVFEKVSKRLPGVRILRQDPLEALMAFICSSNNNITRITSMVNTLCQKYGNKLLQLGSESYFAFPEVQRLDRDGVEGELRAAGFGYRAKYIRATAKELSSREPRWLESLRDTDYAVAHAELCRLPGVGAKVADCVCLMALDKPDVVPVDTHVWQIAVRDYLPHLSKNKTLTDKAYKEVGNFFREKFGPYAGWAHSVLFAADLKPSKARAKES
ncbi:N-glycosylase/DNA lyase-like [Ornithodoros turicata]|uniref:N-glycosylase/DNA lyase-like n=1 Tax=Ornithodoros turicata TaxID=34597 RepID=UPI00313899B5